MAAELLQHGRHSVLKQEILEWDLGNVSFAAVLLSDFEQ